MNDSEQQIAALKTALADCIRALSNPSEGGFLEQMSNLQGRMRWYEASAPIRDNAFALLLKLENDND